MTYPKRLTPDDLDRLRAEQEPGEPCVLCQDTGYYVVNPTRNGDTQFDREVDCPMCEQQRISDSIERELRDEMALAEYAANLAGVAVPEVEGREAKLRLAGAMSVVASVANGLIDAKKGRAA